MSASTTCVIRPYRPEDRAAVRHICCETGFMGDPVDPLFSDRDAFADFFTRYYTDWEPDNAWVAEDEGRVVGYLIGSTRYRRYAVAQSLSILLFTVPKVVWRALTLRYRASDFRFLSWFLVRAAGETPAHPPKAAHFHINLLNGWRDGVNARRLIFAFLDSLAGKPVKAVYGQIQTFDDRRSSLLFSRYGFRELERRRVTKFERFGKPAVYVSTFYKELGSDSAGRPA